jgi:uncharacterized protein YdeI (BOF family)
MKTLLISGGLTIATLLSVPAIALAQTSIQDIQATNSITLSGEIIRISGDDFILDDGTGQILVEAEARPLRRANLTVGETVTVAGFFHENEFEAFRIIRSNGEEIYIFDD